MLVADVFTAPSFFVKDSRTRSSHIPTHVVHPLVDTQLFSAPAPAAPPSQAAAAVPAPQSKPNWEYCRQRIGLSDPSDLVVGACIECGLSPLA